MTVLHLTDSVNVAAGGILSFLLGLTRAVGPNSGVSHLVVGWDVPGYGPVAPFPSGVDLRVIRGTPRKGIAAFALQRRVADTVMRREVDLLHVHNMWRGLSLFARWRAIREGLPYVVSPHGTLLRTAFQSRHFEKRAVLTMWEGPLLRKAACVHVTSQEEHRRVGALCRPARIHRVPIGVDLPPGVLPHAPSAERRMLYLGRIARGKGLDGLLRAWAQVRPAGWQLVLVGPDEGGHSMELEELRAHLELGDAVSLCGPVFGEERWAVITRSRIVVLPSAEENFGLVVGEALAVGRPVLATRGCPWPALEEQRCGWRVSAGEDGLVDGLRKASATQDGELEAMGARGREWVRQTVSWERIGGEMVLMYNAAWRVGRGRAAWTRAARGAPTQ